MANFSTRQQGNTPANNSPHELVNEVVILLPGDPLVPESNVVLVLQQLLPVRAHVQGDWESLTWGDPGNRCVQSKLSNRDAHT